MNDPPDVWLVDAHTKGDSRADDLKAVKLKVILDFLPRGVINLRVIGCRFIAIFFKRLGDRFCRFARETIDDSCLTFACLDKIPDLLYPLYPSPDRELDVWSFKTG